MEYITVFQSPMYHQMSLEEYLFSEPFYRGGYGQIGGNETNTRTYKRDYVNYNFYDKLHVSIPHLVQTLQTFNNLYQELAEADRLSLYENFYQEKHGKGMSYVFKAVFDTQKKYVACNTGAVCSGIAGILRPLISNHKATEHESIFNACESELKDYLSENGFDVSGIRLEKILSPAYRKIDAPVDELKNALRNLKTIFEKDFHALYHTSAFAYVKGRSTLDAVKRHQANESRWFAKYDLSNFFGNTQTEFIMKMLAMVFPFSAVMRTKGGARELRKAVELATLNGALPQGTPISPTITNIVMIPVDYKLSNELRDFNKQRFIYTRYADDFTVSSRYDFNFKEIGQLIEDALAEFGAPFKLNHSKTRYGSSAGQNWNLGVMLNKDNQITIGHKKKRQFKAMLASYVMDRRNGNPWDLNEIQVLDGYRNYYRMVEGETIDKIVAHIGEKFNIDIVKAIKDDLRAS